MDIKKSTTVLIVIIIWLVTAAVGIWEIVLVRELIFRLLGSFLVAGSTIQAAHQADTASSVGVFVVLVLAVIWIAAFIGSAEYHRRHLGEPTSWRLISRIISVELAIFFLVFFI